MGGTVKTTDMVPAFGNRRQTAIGPSDLTDAEWAHIELAECRQAVALASPEKKRLFWPPIAESREGDQRR